MKKKNQKEIKINYRALLQTGNKIGKALDLTLDIAEKLREGLEELEYILDHSPRDHEEEKN